MRRRTLIQIEEWINREFPEATPAQSPEGINTLACWSFPIDTRGSVSVSLVIFGKTPDVSWIIPYVVVGKTHAEIRSSFVNDLPGRESFMSWLRMSIAGLPSTYRDTITQFENECAHLRGKITTLEMAQTILEGE